MPINPQACPGPCNHRARQAWNTYDTALEQHAAHMAAWLNLPGDDRPARPIPPSAGSVMLASVSASSSSRDWPMPGPHSSRTARP